MVERYRPKAAQPKFSDVRSSAYVGRASIKAATIKRAVKDGKDLRKKIGDATSTTDAFQNFGLNIGLGTNNALSQSSYGFSPITRIRTLLEWIHRSAWLGGIAIDLLAKDMTRGGVEILTVEDPKDVEKLQQGLTQLQIWQKMAGNIKWANLYGGSLAVLLIDGQDPSTPLQIDRIARKQFKGIMVLDRWMVEPDLTHLVSDLGPHLGLPQWYRVIADAPAFRGQRIHYTRCVRMIGIELPHWQAVMENLWGLSVFERLYDRMIAFDSATMGAAQLVYKSYLRTYKIDGLHEAATTAGDALLGISKRVELMRKFQGIEGMTLLDTKDDFGEGGASGSFSGISDVLIHFAEQLSGALQIPLVRLLGQSPAGLNSSGESDLRTYYDNILQRQEDEMREGVNTILRVLAMSLGVTLEENFTFNFVPLWQLNEDEKSQISDRDTRCTLEVEAAGLISPRTALKEMRQGSKITGRWTNIDDKMIEEASDEAEPPQPEMGGIDPETGLPMQPGAPGMEGGGEEGGQEGEEGEGEQEPGEGQEAPGEEPGGSPAALKGLQNLAKIKRAIGGAGGNDRRPTLDSSLPYTTIGGLQVVIEQRAGTIRRGEGWSVRMPADYGYLRRIGSAEGPEEWLDVFVGKDHDSRDVWVIDGTDPRTGVWDEAKVMLGFRSSREAVDCFKQAYDDGAARRIGGVTHFDMSELRFKKWLAGDMTQPLTPELRAVA